MSDQDISATLSGVSSTIASISRGEGVVGPLFGDSSCVGVGTASFVEVASSTGVSTLGSTAGVNRLVATPIVCVSGFSSFAQSQLTVVSTPTGNASLVGAAAVAWHVASHITGGSSIHATPIIPLEAELSALATLGASAGVNRGISQPLACVSSLSATALLQHHVTKTLAGDSSLNGTASVFVLAACALVGEGVLSAAPRLIMAVSQDLLGAATVTGATEAIYGPSGEILGQSSAAGFLTRFNPGVGGPKDTSGNYVPE